MKYLKIILLITFFGCATGEKFSDIEEGMSKEQVKNILGKQDQIDKLDGGVTIYYYKNRMISGWSWDKTDYYVIFDPNDKVYSYGHGEIDTRTSQRMSEWGAQQQYLQQQQRNQALEERKVKAIEQINIPHTTTTKCTEYGKTVTCHTR